MYLEKHIFIFDFCLFYLVDDFEGSPQLTSVHFIFICNAIDAMFYCSTSHLTFTQWTGDDGMILNAKTHCFVVSCHLSHFATRLMFDKMLDFHHIQDNSSDRQ